MSTIKRESMANALQRGRPVALKRSGRVLRSDDRLHGRGLQRLVHRGRHRSYDLLRGRDFRQNGLHAIYVGLEFFNRLLDSRDEAFLAVASHLCVHAIAFTAAGEKHKD